MADLSVFSESYAEARGKFVDAARGAGRSDERWCGGFAEVFQNVPDRFGRGSPRR